MLTFILFIFSYSGQKPTVCLLITVRIVVFGDDTSNAGAIDMIRQSTSMQIINCMIIHIMLCVMGMYTENIKHCAVMLNV